MIMRALLRDFIVRFGRAAVFANTGNLTEALRLVEQRQREEADAIHADAARSAAWKLMHRPGRQAGWRPRRQGNRPLLMAH
jgi:hypothetical protein